MIDPTPVELIESARSIIAKVVCSDCDRDIAQVRESPHGPLLILTYPGRDWDALIPLKRAQVGGGRVPVAKGRYVRRLYEDGAPVSDWTSQQVWCDRHRGRIVARGVVLEAVERYRRSGRKRRIPAHPES